MLLRIGKEEKAVSLAALLGQWIEIARQRRGRDRSDVVRRQLMRDLLRAFFGSVMYLVGIGAAYLIFSPLIPHMRLNLFTLSTVIWQAGWLVTLVLLMARNPDKAEQDQIWWPIARIYGIGTICFMIWAVWLFMPYATEYLRLIFVLLSITFVSITIMTGTDTVNLDRFAAIGVLGSMAAYFLVYGGHYALVLAAFILAYAGAMLMLANNMRRSNAAMIAAKQEAEAERDARAGFIASASHDLGQPLQAARLFFDQVLRSEAGAKREKAVRGVSWAFDTSEGLLRQMIDHLRLEAGAVAAEMGDVALGGLIAQMGEHHEPAAQIAGVRIIALPSRLHVRADPALIERALGNLVGNAIRHAKAERVLIGARAHCGRVRLWVIDDGNGIPEADLPRLFTDYSQGSDHGNEVRGGFGLGLASALRIAELMGGSAGLEPKWVDGSAFWLELPAA
jgi:signal transduction histidine kinase